jgi:membrane-associated phospholipid phosphatase
MIVTTLDRLGYYTPYILFFLSLIVIKKRNIFFYYYVGGFLLNYLLNITLKGFLKQPRPDSHVALLNIMKQEGRYVDPQMYGMPSGHAQESFFSLFYVFWLLKNKENKTKQQWLGVFGLLCLITVFQRVMTKKHSVMQIMVGSIIGGMVGTLFYKMGEFQVKGEDKDKDRGSKEDNNQILEGFVN